MMSRIAGERPARRDVWGCPRPLYSIVSSHFSFLISPVADVEDELRGWKLTEPIDMTLESLEPRDMGVMLSMGGGNPEDVDGSDPGS